MIGRIVLDTNLIYYVANLSTGPISQKELHAYICSQDKSCQICISRISLFEIIAKYHKSANIFRRIMCMLRDYHVMVIDNDYYHKNVPLQTQLTKIKQCNLNELWEEVISEKIKVEAVYATAIFVYVMSSVTLFERGQDYTIFSDFQRNFLKEFISIDRDIALGFFKDVFLKGYRYENCEKIVKHAFYSLLDFCVPSLIGACKCLFDGELGKNGVITEDEKKKYRDGVDMAAKQIKRCVTSTEYISKSAILFDKQSNANVLKLFLKDIYSSVSSVIPNTTTREYFYDIIEKCITQKGAFLKNDIIDAMILGTVEDSDVFLTLDIGVIKHMIRYQDKRLEYKKSLDEIERLSPGYTIIAKR